MLAGIVGLVVMAGFGVRRGHLIGLSSSTSPAFAGVLTSPPSMPP